MSKGPKLILVGYGDDDRIQNRDIYLQKVKSEHKFNSITHFSVYMPLILKNITPVFPAFEVKKKKK